VNALARCARGGGDFEKEKMGDGMSVIAVVMMVASVVVNLVTVFVVVGARVKKKEEELKDRAPIDLGDGTRASRIVWLHETDEAKLN